MKIVYTYLVVKIYIFFLVILNGQSFGTALRRMPSVLLEFSFQSINPLFVVPQLFPLKRQKNEAQEIKTIMNLRMKQNVKRNGRVIVYAALRRRRFYTRLPLLFTTTGTAAMNDSLLLSALSIARLVIRAYCVCSFCRTRVSKSAWRADYNDILFPYFCKL